MALLFTFPCMFQWLAVPFAWLHEAVTPIGQTAREITNSTGHVVMDGWLGTFPTDHWAGNWVDGGLLLIFGGIPWQVDTFYPSPAKNDCVF